MSMATSGTYNNFFEIDGVQYSHLINPMTGLTFEFMNWDNETYGNFKRMYRLRCIGNCINDNDSMNIFYIINQLNILIQ